KEESDENPQPRGAQNPGEERRDQSGEQKKREERERGGNRRRGDAAREMRSFPGELLSQNLTSRRKQIGGGGDEPVQTRDDPGPRAVSFVDAFRLRHVLRPAAKRALLFSALAGVRRGSTPGEASRVLGARSRELLPCLRERKWCRRGQRRAN